MALSKSSREALFGYKSEHNQFGTIFRPYIAAEIWSNLENDWISFPALVDSGSDYIVLPRSACDAVGLKIDDGKPFSLTGVGGSIQAYLYENVKVRVGEIEFDTPVAFTKDELPLLLFGRETAFSKFEVRFNQKNLEGRILDF